MKGNGKYRDEPSPQVREKFLRQVDEKIRERNKESKKSCPLFILPLIMAISAVAGLIANIWK